MTKKTAKRRGPKTLAGKLTISTNAKTHGILSPRPVVTDFESEKDWKEYRKSIITALAPEGGMEQALAERVALASWRLNRVTVYETQLIAQEQERVIEEVRKDRETTLRFARLDGYAREAREMIAGTVLENVVDPKEGRLSDLAIESVSPPEVALEGAANVRRYYEAVREVYDGGDVTISYGDASWLLDNAPY
jgi:sporulation protein YlmC with PRC-barrel domain